MEKRKDLKLNVSGNYTKDYKNRIDSRLIELGWDIIRFMPYQLDDDLEWYCPNCGNRDHDLLNVARRTCGYIGANFWNKGRTQEIKERVLHIDNKDDE